MRPTAAWLVLPFLVLPLWLVACGGGGGGGGGGSGPGDGFILLTVNHEDHDGVLLNEEIVLTFSEAVLPSSVLPETVQIREGPSFGRQAEGTLTVDGAKVTFRPRLPCRPDGSDAGFRANTDYRIRLPGGGAPHGVRSVSGEALPQTATAMFRTVVGGDVRYLDDFPDPSPAGVKSLSPAPDGPAAPTSSAVVLTFNRRPLDPATVTPERVRVSLVERDGRPYDRLVPGTLALVQDYSAVAVTFTPVAPLAKRARYRVTVGIGVRDLVGGAVTLFTGEFATADEPLHPSDMTIRFDDAERASLRDEEATTADWSQVRSGALTAVCTAGGGTGEAGDFCPSASATLSAADFTRGAAVELVDGVTADVLNFRDIRIPSGVTVRFVPRPAGPNRPIVLLALREVRIDGSLSVAGGAGTDGEGTAWNSSLAFAPGGASGPGGGAGATAYAGALHMTAPPLDGGDVPRGAGGGRGGQVSGDSRYSYAGGGGGGGSRLPGFPGLPGGYTVDAKQNGTGGLGGGSETARGYGPNLDRRPNVGGAGGGAGGLGYRDPVSGLNWRQSAGSGGGGGGALSLASAGPVTFGPGGRILAAGGTGGRVSNHSSHYGGGGGGGGGGSVLVRAGGGLFLGAGSVIDVAGGLGGVFTSRTITYKGGEGGRGGDGSIRLEAGASPDSPFDPHIEGYTQAKLTPACTTSGLFVPAGGGVPSTGQTKWIALPVFDPVLTPPAQGDIDAFLFDDIMEVEVQMAAEDPFYPEKPDLGALDTADTDRDGLYDDTTDPTRMSEWTPLHEGASLAGRGYRFLRVRVRFSLAASHAPADPRPWIETLRIRYSW